MKDEMHQSGSLSIVLLFTNKIPIHGILIPFLFCSHLRVHKTQEDIYLMLECLLPVVAVENPLSLLRDRDKRECCMLHASRCTMNSKETWPISTSSQENKFDTDVCCVVIEE